MKLMNYYKNWKITLQKGDRGRTEEKNDHVDRLEKGEQYFIGSQVWAKYWMYHRPFNNWT